MNTDALPGRSLVNTVGRGGASLAGIAGLSLWQDIHGHEIGCVFIIDVANSLLSFDTPCLLGPLLVVQLGVIMTVLLLRRLLVPRSITTDDVIPTNTHTLPPIRCCPVHTIVDGIVFAHRKLNLSLNLGR